MRITRVALRHGAGTSSSWTCGCASFNTDTVTAATIIEAAAPSCPGIAPSAPKLHLQPQPLSQIPSKHKIRTDQFRCTWKGTGIYRQQHALPPSSHSALSTSSLSAAAEIVESGNKAEEARFDPDSQFLQALSERLLPPPDMQEAYRTAQESRLRFSDLPATPKLMESFVSDAPSTDPIYDLPTWLQNNAPQHDTRPKSPFYHWQSWMSHSLPLDQQRSLLAFDEHMGVEASRGALTRQAQFELSRLWDWQHRRIAAGLPLQPTAVEVQQAAMGIPSSSAVTVAATPPHTVTAAAKPASTRGVVALSQMGFGAEASSAPAQQTSFVDATAQDTTLVSSIEASSHSSGDVVSAESAQEVPAAAAGSDIVPADLDSAAAVAAVAAESAPAPATNLASSMGGLFAKIARDYRGGSDELVVDGALKLMEEEQRRYQLSVTHEQNDLIARLRTNSRSSSSSSGLSGGSSSSSSGMMGAGNTLGLKAGLKALSGVFAERLERGQLASEFDYSQRVTDTYKREMEERSVIVKEATALGLDPGNVDTHSSRTLAALSSAYAPPPPMQSETSLAAEDAAKKKSKRRGKQGPAVVQSEDLSNSTLDPLSESKNWYRARGHTALEAVAEPAERERGQLEEVGSEAKLWSSTALLDHDAHISQLKLERKRASQEVAEVLEGEDRLLQLHSHDYSHDLRVTPPTPTLALLTDYLQVKYQDILLQKDASAHVSGRVANLTTDISSLLAHDPTAPLIRMQQHQTTHTPLLTTPSNSSSSLTTPSNSSSSGSSVGLCGLSASEVSALNVQADSLWAGGAVGGMGPYINFMERLASDGLLPQWELAECLAAAQLQQEQNAAAQALHPTSTHPTHSHAATATSAQSTSPATAKQQQLELLSFLAGNSDVHTLLSHTLVHTATAEASSPSLTANTAGSSSRMAQAMTLWDAAGKSGFAECAADSAAGSVKGHAAAAGGSGPGYSAWVVRMRGASKQDVAAARNAGASISLQEEKDLDLWWQAPPTPFTAALQEFDSYSRSAALPSLAGLVDILLADRDARSASSAATISKSDSASVADLHPSVAEVEEKQKRTYLAYAARQGSTMGNAAGSPEQEVEGSGAVAPASWQTVQQQNARLDVSDPVQLRNSFQPLTLQQVLQHHLDTVTQRFQLGESTESQPSHPKPTAAPLLRFDDLYSTMTQVYAACTSGSSRSDDNVQSWLQHSAPLSADSQLAQNFPLTFSTGVTSSAATPVTEDTSARAHSDNGNVHDHVPSAISSVAQEEQSPTAATATPGSLIWAQQMHKLWHSGTSAPLDGDLAIADPEVSDIAAASLLAQRHAAAASGSSAPAAPYEGARKVVRFTQTMVLHAGSAFAPHPRGAAVTLRVAAAQLGREAGLSCDGLQYLLRLAGPERYNPASGDLELVGSRYGHREDNRRLLMQQLHQLVDAGKSAYPN